MAKIIDFTGGGSLPSDNFTGGSFDAQDTATSGTKIIIPGTSVFTDLTNNALGAQTIDTYSPTGMDPLWIPADDEFDFTQLKLGDIVDIRVDIDVITASPNTQCTLRLLAGIGVFSFPIGWENPFYGSSDTHPLVRTSFITMQTETIRTGAAKFQLASDKACTVQVKGWNYAVRVRG